MINGNGSDSPAPAAGGLPPERQRDPTLQLVAQAPMPAPMDGFQRALMLEQRKLCDVFATAPRGMQETLTSLSTDLYAILRSPIHPKNGYLAFADQLMHLVTGAERHIHLHGVLASPTALAEVRGILHCAALFKRHGFSPRVRLFLVRWENLIDIRQQSMESRAHAFEAQVRGVADAALHAGFADAVLPIDVDVDSTTGEILYPLDFGAWARRVLSAYADPRGACPSLAKDVEWSTGFYARQESLRRLGVQQALHDLAIRRAIGERVSTEHTADPAAAGRAAVMTTLELHKRFLPCYAASVPILNLDGRACIRSAATTAVA